MSWFNKYQFIQEGELAPWMPAIGGVFGIWVPHRPCLESQSQVPWVGRHRHRLLCVYYRRQPLQVAETFPILQQYLDHQSGKYLSGQWQQCTFP